MDAFIGEIRIFGGNFAPSGFAFCNGQQLPIQSYSALYAIIGVQYGGDGRTYFNLPNLQGKVAMGMGAGNGLTTRINGQTPGVASYTLNQNTMPAHNHPLNGTAATGAVTTPANGFFGSVSTARGAVGKYSVTAPNTTLDPASIGSAGSATVLPIANLQPYLALNYIIALEGEYPVRQ